MPLDDRDPVGEYICKGCSELNAELKDELLALREKTEVETSRKCKKCGANIGAKHRFCNACGEPVS
jgi:DNA-directed RNA polymerase subunit RPC12/RpoP